MLHYRFPGQDLISLSGDFIELKDYDNQGFIITDFNQQKKYIWSESASPTPFNASTPYCIDKESYLTQARQIVKDLNKGIADKVVYTRIKKSSASAIDAQQLFARLLQTYPNALVYYFHDTSIGDWIGASPEILIQKTPTDYRTMALAGTKLAGENRDFTYKEYNEHAMVTEFIEGQLRQIPNAQLRISELNEYSQGPVTHLLQELRWQMPATVLPLLLKFLHPTPAVAGLPQKVALQYLRAIEQHQREFYTGIIGDFQAGKEQLYVNLRCAQLINGDLYSYVGGGFTPDSDPELEWDETENKSKTLLQLL
ncbi:MAG: chorismate-binding protein [Flavobacteriales bacterium]